MPRIRPVLESERVRCDECGARPYVRCTSSGGVARKPHGVRDARLVGLAQTPRRGWFVPARGPRAQYDADEIQAAERRRVLPAAEGGMIACASCGATGVRIDLDVRSTPPEHVCVTCKRKPKCTLCGKRRNRLTVDGEQKVCCPCIKRRERDLAAFWLRACTACLKRIDISETNEHGECADCSVKRLYREHPIARSAS